MIPNTLYAVCECDKNWTSMSTYTGASICANAASWWIYGSICANANVNANTIELTLLSRHKLAGGKKDILPTLHLHTAYLESYYLSLRRDRTSSCARWSPRSRSCTCHSAARRCRFPGRIHTGRSASRTRTAALCRLACSRTPGTRRQTPGSRSTLQPSSELLHQLYFICKVLQALSYM